MFKVLLLLFTLFISYSLSGQEIAANLTKAPSGKQKLRPALIRGPYLQVATTNSIVVRWRTDAAARSRDRFTIMKGVNKIMKLRMKKGRSADLTASFLGSYKWNKSGSADRTLSVTPTKTGTMVYEVQDTARGLKDRFEITVTNQ